MPQSSTTRARRAAVSGAYAAQGLGYAAVVTALPAVKERVGIDDTVVSLILLGVCLAAAAGSILADLIAVRWGSRQALVTGFVAQALALVLIAASAGFGLLVVAVAIYGVGLGAVDASSNMQGALVQRHYDRPIFGHLYAAYTAAAIVATAATAGILTIGAPAWVTLAVAAGVMAAVAVWGVREFDPERAAREVGERRGDRPPLPRAEIWAVGAFVFAAFVVDAAVSSWSTIYLTDGLGAPAGLTPLGYGAYLVAVLVARLCTDAAVRTAGRVRVGLTAIVLVVIGGVLVGTLHTTAGAVAGFALMGAAAGTLVPLAFSRAGELLPARSDEVIARVNLFNYAGAVVGAVVVGVVAAGPALGPAFLIPTLVLALSTPLLRTLRRR